MKNNRPFPAEMFQFLTNVGLVGIECGRFQEAQTIFDIIVNVLPNDLNAKIVQALGLVFTGKWVEGAKALAAILKEDPKNEQVLSFFAMVFKMGKIDGEAMSIIHTILQNSQNESARQLAQEMLNDYRNHIKPDQLNAEQAARVGKKELYVH